MVYLGQLSLIVVHQLWHSQSMTEQASSSNKRSHDEEENEDCSWCGEVRGINAWECKACKMFQCGACVKNGYNICKSCQKCKSHVASPGDGCCRCPGWDEEEEEEDDDGGESEEEADCFCIYCGEEHPDNPRNGGDYGDYTPDDYGWDVYFCLPAQGICDDCLHKLQTKKDAIEPWYEYSGPADGSYFDDDDEEN